jgi:hypothetical protein
MQTRKPLALLAYLAAERELHPRDQPAALLWPDRGEAEARNSLRSALVYLRQALGDADAALAVTRETVGLSLSPSFILDIQVLAQAQRLEALEALGRRSLLERGAHGVTITLPPVVLEYATDRLVEVLTREIAEGRPALLRSHALLKATAEVPQMNDVPSRSGNLVAAIWC